MTSMLTSGKVWIAVLAIAVVGVVIISILGKDVPPVLDAVIYGLLGAGGGGGAAKLAAEVRLAKDGRPPLSGVTPGSP
jgi:hypothetical protein